MAVCISFVTISSMISPSPRTKLHRSNVKYIKWKIRSTEIKETHRVRPLSAWYSFLSVDWCLSQSSLVIGRRFTVSGIAANAKSGPVSGSASRRRRSVNDDEGRERAVEESEDDDVTLLTGEALLRFCFFAFFLAFFSLRFLRWVDELSLESLEELWKNQTSIIEDLKLNKARGKTAELD